MLNSITFSKTKPIIDLDKMSLDSVLQDIHGIPLLKKFSLFSTIQIHVHQHQMNIQYGNYIEIIPYCHFQPSNDRLIDI